MSQTGKGQTQPIQADGSKILLKVPECTQHKDSEDRFHSENFQLTLPHLGGLIHS